MSGVTITYKITKVFGASADPTTITLPVPNVSPGSPAPNRASFDTAFPAICFKPITSGGQPPSGKDFNGVFFMLSQYALSMQGGQSIVGYDAATQTAIGGYAENALLAKASGFGYWLNLVAGNMTDPDDPLTSVGWSALTPDPTGVLQLAEPGGTYNNFDPPGFDGSVGFLDITPSGDIIITGIAAGGDGQYLVVTNLSGTHTVTLNSLDAGSLAQNQMRLPGNIVLVPNNGVCLRYSLKLALWVLS
jgi:hypothetical protein